MKEVFATLFRHGLRGLHGFFLFFYLYNPRNLHPKKIFIRR